MAQIGDTPEQQALRALNEAKRTQKALSDKKGDAERRGRAFNDVMSHKVAGEQAKRANQKQAGKRQAETKGEGKKAKLVAKEKPKTRAEQAKRSALSAAARQGMVKGRGKAQKTDKTTEIERVAEQETRGAEEVEHVDREVRSDDLQDAQKADEQLFVELSVDPDGQQGQSRQQKDREGGSSGDQREDGPGGIAAAEGGGGAHHVKLPPQLVEQIAKAIAIATAADGRSEFHIALKGDMLEGVTLKVGLRKGGKVRCTFEGCDRTTKNLIESSKGDLMRALAKKGMELDILRAR